MPALAFDTYAYVKKLRDAGVPESQAEIQVEAIVAVIKARMATKKDLELQKVEIQRDITELKRDIKELDVTLEREIAGVKLDIKELDVKLETRIKELEMRLLIRLGGILFAGIGALAILIKLL